MKKVWTILLIGGALSVAYNMFIYWFPVKRNSYYTNEERAEAYVFDKREYAIVTVGSSLSGSFEGRKLFPAKYFNLFMPRTGSCTGVEIIKRSNRIPKYLFVEINHIDRGIDSGVIDGVFDPSVYNLKHYLPILQTKSKLLTNVVDLAKKPSSSVNKKQPPPALFAKLLTDAKREWSEYPDPEKFDKQFNRLIQSLDHFTTKGCKIYFFEMPIDISLRNSKLISYQRNRMIEIAKQKGYAFIPADTSRAYQTGDGIHLLQADRDIYVKYFQEQVKKTGITANL